ncbi:KR domain-containing protein, partial [Streptomyces sp. NPDC052196]|uniref:KR domain-containing protein n=1 Tax=Streptomyces sp. NPDC052196 TaxID=3156691 RepID=UPI0034312CA0
GNAFLHALAHHRRAQGLPGLSLDWGPWATASESTGRPLRFRLPSPSRPLDDIRRVLLSSP